MSTDVSKSTPFMFNEKELLILKNFSSGINQQMVIKPTGLEVINAGKSCIGNYEFETPYEFPEFGLYECNEFLTVLGAFQSPSITVKDKLLVISNNDSKVNYFTTAKELLPKTPNVSEKFEKLDCELCFNLSGEKLNIINKMASIMKSKFLFFETDKKKIRITIADQLDSSSNSYEVTIDDGITANKLTEPVKLNLSEFKLLPGDYTIKLSTKISKWENLNGAVYFLSTSI